MLNPSKNDVVNMHVCNVTTPAQYFHLLRRQMKRNYRKPLILASPKILLRHAKCTSLLEEMGPGTTFSPVLDDIVPKDTVDTIVFCSGKIYYDLVQEREKRDMKNFGFIRIEELCPFPVKNIQAMVSQYKNCKTIKWAQEEHQNQGCWNFVQPRLDFTLSTNVIYAGREPSACPATGVSKYHKQEVELIFNEIFK
eukprot:NODE_356_length_8904_cov_1.034412.p6 type:complete len:195 gc:universal NODE_356_length_8904_cov_1.034412:4255-4839(+)